MTDIAKTDELFFARAGLDRTRVEGIVSDALGNADDGELFLEYEQSESFVFDDGQLKIPIEGGRRYGLPHGCRLSAV